MSITHRRSRFRGVAGWVLFDWAAQPVYTLVLTFLFAPYFANVFLTDPVRGQAVWGYLVAAAGLVVAFASPVLGAVADATGRRKIWVAGFSVALVIGLTMLWFAEPGAETRLAFVAAGIVLALVAAEFATVFTNAMMADLVPSGRLGRLSGIGWAVGYAGGLVSLVLTAGFLVADPESGRTLLGLVPLLPLDVAAHEGERAVGPFSALWYMLFVLPLFFFTPDVAGRGLGARRALAAGWAQLRQTFADLGRYAALARFLLARMLYVDGLGAIFAFGGLYAASLFGWSAADLGLFGIVLTIAGAVGALLGGMLDDRWGARSVILWALSGLIVASLGVLSVDAEHVLFVVDADASSPGDGAFASTGARVYLAFALLLGLVAGPLQASSRSFLARLAPPEMRTEFFGLFAFSGKITAFAAPLLIAVVTAWTGSQRLGIATLLVFLLSGLALMLTVREAPAAASQ